MSPFWPSIVSARTAHVVGYSNAYAGPLKAAPGVGKSQFEMSETIEHGRTVGALTRCSQGSNVDPQFKGW